MTVGLRGFDATIALKTLKYRAAPVIIGCPYEVRRCIGYVSDRFCSVSLVNSFYRLAFSQSYDIRPATGPRAGRSEEKKRDKNNPEQPQLHRTFPPAVTVDTTRHIRGSSRDSPCTTNRLFFKVIARSSAPLGIE
jgi:hypothetical protein